MIKKYWDITLRDWDIMEKTGNVSQFLEWWNILPVALFKKGIEKVRAELIKRLNNNSSGESEAFEKLHWQTESLNNINALRIAYNGLIVELKYKPQINELKRYAQKFTWKRIRLSKIKYAQKYIDEIKKLTGVEIKDYDDIEKVRKQLEFKIDKYNENFKPQETEGKHDKVYLMGFALGVFAKLPGIVFNPSQITVIEFIDARNEVLKRKPVKQDNNA